MIKLKTRSVTVLTDDEVKLVSGGTRTDLDHGDNSWFCDSGGCGSMICWSNGCDSFGCGSEGHCDSDSCVDCGDYTQHFCEPCDSEGC